MFSWNSTHTAMIVLAAITIAGFHYGVKLSELAIVIAPLGAYIALREKARLSEV